MKRAIVKRFIVVLIVAMAISSIVISMSYYRLASHRVMEDMKPVLLLLDATIDWESSDLEKQIVEISSQMNNDYRITIIDNDGSVLADSETGNPETMENHKNRKEVKEAFQNGFGTKVRNSSTIKGSMMYAAYCSPTQHKVIRISIHHDVITDLMKMMVPSIAISLLLALSVAGVLTNKFAASVTKPILEISHKLEGIYDEKIDFNFPHYQYDELNIIARTTTDMSKSVQDYIRKLEKEKTIRQEFFSNASHELKTPLTSMKVRADSINSMEDAPVELYKEFMGDIGNEVDRETKIINDLLSLVKMDKAAGDLNITNININELLEQILKRLRPIADKQKVELVLESFRPVSADVDEVKITLAFTNLIENAIKYNKEDGWVHVSLNADHQYFYLKVEDSGIGIPEDSLEHIYERFYRVDKSHSREIGGTGLGLAITRNAVLMHRGAIKVFSTEGEGTIFNVRIPLNYIS